MQERIQCRGGPTESGAVSRNKSLKVNSPRVQSLCEVQSIGWYDDFGGPAGSGNGGACVPYSVPIEARLLGACDQTVQPRAGAIYSEVITGAMVAIGVQHERNSVVAFHV